jgi:hypothetical protein
VAPSDLSILGTAATQLFQSTSHMSTDAVVSVMIALVEVARRALPAFQANPAQPKPAALVRLVEVVLANTSRVMVRACRRPGLALRLAAPEQLVGQHPPLDSPDSSPSFSSPRPCRPQPPPQPLPQPPQPDPPVPRPTPAPTPRRTSGPSSWTW